PLPSSSLSMLPPPPSSTLFPYTTLFRSLIRPRDRAATANDVADMRRAVALEKGEDDLWDLKYAAGGLIDIDFIAQHLQLVYAARSEEHTSELQSPCNLVCRLLLEKKKNK